MPMLSTRRVLEAPFVAVEFTPDGRHLIVLEEHALTYHDLRDHSARVVWSDGEVSCRGLAVDGVDVFVLGQRGDHFVWVELDARASEEQRRREDPMEAPARFDVRDALLFTHEGRRHVVARCAEGDDGFMAHWRPDVDAPPLILETPTFSDVWARRCVPGACVVVNDVLYDAADRCVVAFFEQDEVVYWLDPERGRGFSMDRVIGSTAEIYGCWSGGGEPSRDVTFEHEYDEYDDSWEVSAYQVMSVSRDGRWMVGLDAWQGVDPGGGGGLPAHLGVWDTTEGRLHAELDTRGFGFEGGRAMLSPDDRVLCVCYEGVIELFEVELPGAGEGRVGLRRVQELTGYSTWPVVERPEGDWSGCPLNGHVARALESAGVTYAGEGKGDRSYVLPANVSWWSAARGGSWSGEDPEGEFNVIAPHVWSVVDHLEWPDEPMSLRTVGGYVEVEFIDGATEQLDCMVDGARRLIHFIAYGANQVYYGVDLLERGFEVSIYAVDHDLGDGAHVAFGDLASYAYALKPTAALG